MSNGEIYFRESGGVLAQPITNSEAKEELKCIPDISCGDNDIRLYRRLRGRGYYQPELCKDVTALQKNFAKCVESFDVGESSLFKKRLESHIWISFGTVIATKSF